MMKELRYTNIEHIHENINQLPDKLVPFCWFFIKQLGWPLLVSYVAITIAYIILSCFPLFASQLVQLLEENAHNENLWIAIKPLAIKFIFLFVIIAYALVFFNRHVFAQQSSAFRDLIVRQLTFYALQHDMSFFQNDYAGRLASKITDTANSLRDNLQNSIYGLNFACINFTVIIITGLFVHPVFSLLIGFWTILYISIICFFIPHILKKASLSQNAKTQINGSLVDTLSNIFTVKIFARKDHEMDHLLKGLYKHVYKGRDLAFSFNHMHITNDVVKMSMFILISAVCVYMVDKGEMEISHVAFIIPVMITLSSITTWMSETLFFYFEAYGNIQDGIRTLVKPFELTDKDGAKDLKINEADITLDNVTFAYESQPVFEELNLNIPAGQKIGLVGPSGAGKTTLVQLLLRLHDIQSGIIKIDGQNISDVTQNSLREHIAVIPQHTDLLHRSIRENIAYGKPEANDAEIIEAAKRAHAHEFILGLVDHESNKGYDAMVGERGVKLSGGQRQRIAIARAILKDAPILLLDEATSALDSESERLIQESLAELMVGRTVIAIAHRLSTISKLDRLLVMQDGAIIEDGTHHNLLKNKGLYARLWQLQSGGFIGDE